MKLSKQTSLVVLLTTFSLAASPFSQAGDAYYRWNDKWGNPVHSDRPPPQGTEYEIVESGSSLIRKVQSTEGVVPVSAPTKPGGAGQEETKPAPRQKDADLCNRAQKNLETLNSRARIRLRDENGEIRYLSEEDKKVQREEAQALISVHCD